MKRIRTTHLRNVTLPIGHVTIIRTSLRITLHQTLPASRLILVIPTIHITHLNRLISGDLYIQQPTMSGESFEDRFDKLEDKFKKISLQDQTDFRSLHDLSSNTLRLKAVRPGMFSGR